jgi:competence protein ComEA
MNKRKKYFKQCFGFSKGEASGFLILLLLLVLFIALPFIFNLLPNSDKKNDYKDEAKLKALQEQLLANIDKKSLDEKQEQFEYDNNYDKFSNENYPSKSGSLFRFDPNEIDKQGLVSLGIPQFIADRIIKYRNAGGTFKKKEDLKKIYGFLPATYAKLEPYIDINKSNNAISIDPSSEKLTFEPTKTVETKFGKKTVMFDLNQADTTTLMTVKGIGSKLSQRIIKFRDNLGGFHNPNQIKEVFGLDSSVVIEILRYGSVKTPFKKININEASEIKHPYLKPFVAKAIIAYRNQHGKYNNIEDLSKVKIMDANTLLKLKPYLTF